MGIHRSTEPPGNDKPREIIQYGRQVVPSPASNFEIGEVGLPHFIDARCWMLKLVSCLHENVGWTGDQIMSLQ